MRLTRDRKKYNRLVRRFVHGGNWVTSTYDIESATWRDTRHPTGWSPFGRPLWEPDELDAFIADAQALIDNLPCRTDYNDHRALITLCDLGIVIQD